MAAVLALVFLPVLASVGLMVKANGAPDLGTMLAMACFVSMAAGVFYGVFRLAANWDSEDPRVH